MKKAMLGVGVVLAAAVAAPVAFGQNTRSQGDEIEKVFAQRKESGRAVPSDLGFSPEADKYVTAPLGTKKDLVWDVGGWVRSTFSTFDTQLGFDRTLKDFDLRVWGEVKYHDNTKLYARVRSFFADYNSGDSPSGHDHDWQRLRSDQVFVENQIARIAGLDAKYDLDLTLGRQFFFMGKGVAMASVLDGARLFARSGEWQADFMAAKTIHNTPDIDATVPETDHESDRLFAGGIVSTTAFGERRFYLYALSETDQNGYKTGTQSFDYNAFYLGFGAEGGINIGGFKPNELGYSAELVVQSGKSNATGSAKEESILAYGLLADFFWLPGDRLPFKSRGILTYAFGSGDADRGLQLGTVGGNRAGTKDGAFNYFGYVNTGYSLSPRLTNMHMVKANFEGSVAESVKLGASLYGFFKHHVAASITDFTAVKRGRFIGAELDVYLDWSVASDLDVGIRYGAFKPGGSYSQKDQRNYLSLYASLSF
jgi:hypothetical protein